MAKILIAGDFAPLNRIARMTEKGDYSYFDEVRGIISEYDYAIVNLEAPLVKSDTSKISKWGPNLKGPANATEALAYAGFKMVTLANNHINDYGADGIRDSVELLEKSGIRYTGIGDNLKESEKISYVKIKDETIAIINCCEYEFSIATDDAPGANPMEPIRQYHSIKEAREKADTVIVIIHGGTENFQYPSQRMIDTYRFFIECGADAVVNHHQHCISGYEIYRDRPIYYGLGNFCFDLENKSLSNWNKGYMVVIDTDNLKTINIIPYIQCFDKAAVSVIDTNAFSKDLENINNIIRDPQSIKKVYADFCEKYINNTALTFEPYSNRLLCALFRRRLIPSLISKKTLNKIRCNILCESHLEKIKYYIHKKML